MRLTPVDVRGTRKKGVKRKAAWKPPNPKRFQLERARDQKMGHASRKRRISLIEQLPVEILEQIFMHSENLNFPRCSLRLGHLLSAKTFLLELLVTAFKPTWDVWFGCSRGQVLSYWGYQADLARFGGKPDFQVCT
jgi:hypothetical protein